MVPEDEWCQCRKNGSAMVMLRVLLHLEGAAGVKVVASCLVGALGTLVVVTVAQVRWGTARVGEGWR